MKFVPALGALGLLLPLTAIAGSAPLPASDPAWADLARICAAGLTGEPCPVVRPLPRDRVVEMVAQAVAFESADPASISSAMHASISRLRHEFREDLYEGWGTEHTALKGPASWSASPRVVGAGVQAFADSAARPPIFDDVTGQRVGEEASNRGFVPTRPAAYGWVRAVAEGLGPFALAGTLYADLNEPGDETRTFPAPQAREGGVASQGLADATLTATIGCHLTVTAGRQSPSWGPSERGNLLLSDGSAGVEMVDVAVTRPWHGLFADANAIHLEDYQSAPWILDQRIGWSPFSFLTLDAQRAIECCDNTSGTRISDIPTILFTTRAHLDGDRLNFKQLASVNATANLPRSVSNALPSFLRGAGASAFYEYGASDFFGWNEVQNAGGFPKNFPHLTAVSSVQGATASVGPLTLHAEYAMLGKTSVNFYENSHYPGTWTWQGLGLVDPIGGRALSTDVEGSVVVGEGFEVGARWLDERYNQHTPDLATRQRAGITETMTLPMEGEPRLRLLVERVNQTLPAGRYLGVEGTAWVVFER